MAGNANTFKQIPENAILDLNGRQAYLGNAYVFPSPASGFTLADTTEHPIMLLINPLTSGKSIFMFSRNVSATDTALVRYYADPTVTSAGTPTTIINTRIGASSTSVATAHNSPTIASNGTFIDVVGVEALLESENTVLFILDPGHTLLMTAESPPGDAVVFQQLFWYEIPYGTAP